MERNIQKNGLINLLVLLVVALGGFAVARYGNTLAGQVAVYFIGLGVLVAAVSWFQMRLENNERLEKLEFDELAKGRGSSALFEGKDSEVFPAQRSREQFERFFVPVFTVVLFLLQAGGVWFVWRWLGNREGTDVLRDPILAMSLFALFALTLFLLGKFSATLARIEGHRLLRPSASFVLLGAYLCFFVALGIVGVQAGFPILDRSVAFGLAAVLALVAAETLINLILEIYRPRLRGKIERPLYESRLVGLLGQPEGLITTAAQALDYQFGFKVSETWFYRFFEKALGWLLLLQFAVLALSTCIVFIEAGEQGLLERFGKPVPGRTLLNPGAHLKLPWPIDRVFRYRTEQVQTFTIGSAPDPDHDKERTILWTVAHTKEENFLVANRSPGSLPETTASGGKRTPPVSLITGSVPIQFQITNLVSWAYENEDASSLLSDLATREVVRYLVGADMSEIMSHGRGKASQILTERIQQAADNRKLGAKILMAGLQDLHPPGKVAAAYERVVAAQQQKQAAILNARAEGIRTNALAIAQAVNLTNRATSDRLQREIGSASRAALFTNQMPAFAAAPEIYTLRAYLQAFARGTEGARKYVILTTNTAEVLSFDLQDKIREDLLNMNVSVPKK